MWRDNREPGKPTTGRRLLSHELQEHVCQKHGRSDCGCVCRECGAAKGTKHFPECSERIYEDQKAQDELEDYELDMKRRRELLERGCGYTEEELRFLEQTSYGGD